MRRTWKNCTKRISTTPVLFLTIGVLISTRYNTCLLPMAPIVLTSPTRPVIAPFAERAKQGPIRTVVASADTEMGRKRVAATQLIASYRDLGSRFANLDPLQRQERPSIPELEPSFYGFSDADMDIVFNISNTYFGQETASLRDLLNALRETYCRSIGAEFMYISDPAEVRWMQERLEPTRACRISRRKRKSIFSTA